MLTHEQREDIKHAVETMRGGGVILYPTDTIWGLGCDATNPEAVAKIYAIKQREDAKALISLVDSEAKIDFYVPDVPDVAWQLLEVAERPLTIIYDNVRNLAPNLMAEDGSAALRITREEFSRELCLRMKRAVVSTSANLSGKPAPRRFSDISAELLEAVDYVCTSRRDEKDNGLASSIIKLTASSEVTVIRE